MHVASTKAKICCVETCKAVTQMPNEVAAEMAHSPILSGNCSAPDPSGFPQIILPPPPPPPTLPANFSTLSMDQKLDALMLKAVTNEQISSGTRDSVQSILPVIENHTEAIRLHDERLTSLEQRAQASAQTPTSDLVVDNIPVSLRLAFTPTAVAKNLLAVLKIPQIYQDVLESREFIKKLGSDKYSIIISFKSNFIRDFVIKSKRQFGKLDQATLLGVQGGTDQIFVSEFLNTSTYRLLTEAKKWKRDSGWPGFIWVQNSAVHVRSGTDRSVKSVVISCIDDLKRLS